MPLYTYKCNDCGTVFEQQQRMTDQPIRECPTCEGTVRRLINNVGIVFKGSGFYVTDNRNGKSHVTPPGTANKAEEVAKAGQTEKGEGGTKETTSAASSSSDKPAAASTPSKKESAAAAAD